MNVMNDKNVFEEYERIVREQNNMTKFVYNSKEYRYGKKMLRIIDLLKHMHLLTLVKELHDSKYAKSVLHRFDDITIEKKRPKKATHTLLCSSPNDYDVTVYTCIVGKYDLPRLPVIKYANYRFVLFTDQEIESFGCWEVIRIPQKIIQRFHNDACYINRYYKFHPHDFFSSSFSVYIDGNVTLTTGVDDLISCVNDSGIAMFDHSCRDCLYREGEICIALKRGNPEMIEKQLSKYRKDGMPENYGLKEATVIISDLNNQRSKRILQLWWEEFCSSNSKRDQLSLPFILWKNGYKIDEIGYLGSDLKADGHFFVEHHLL